MAKNCFCVVVLLLCTGAVLCANPFLSPVEKSPGIDSGDGETVNNSPMSVRSGASSPGTVKVQKNLRERIGELFYNIESPENKEERFALYVSLLFFSFLYGIIHAAGPGHRKTIVFSMYTAKKAPWWEPALTSFLLAFLHGGCAVALILIFRGVEGAIGIKTERFSVYMEGFSYILIILLALFIMINEIVEFCSQKKHNTKIEGKKYSGYVLFLISGLYPCPGAILVLILSHTLGILVSGIFSVIAMSAGMMIPIAIAGYLAWFGREGVFRILKDRGNVIRVVSLVLTVASCIFLCIFSIYIAWPFLITVL